MMFGRYLPAVLFGCLLFLFTSDCFSESEIIEGKVAREVMKFEHSGKNLLKKEAWQPFEKGFERKAQLIFCDNKSNKNQARGISQSVVLNQQYPEMIIATLESKAENVGGDADNEYSVYLDFTFTDGTELYGQAMPFDVGSHDWQSRKVVVFPKKAVKSIAYYALMRQHTGKVWFRKPKLTSQALPKNVHRVDNKKYTLHGNPYKGFQVRDVKKNGSFVHLKKEAIGLQLDVLKQKKPGVTFFDVTIRKTSKEDRAITLAYCLPITGDDFWWLADPRKRQKIEPNLEYANTQSFEGVGNEKLSRYPLAALANHQQGVAVGIDMKHPAFYRLVYQSKTKEILLLFDLGFTDEKPTAKLRFCKYSFAPQFGFRAALHRYYQLFPDEFHCRIKHQGNWMPFAKISEVKSWKDFGFAFKEGNNETAWDDANNITTFRYTEPMTWWMEMPVEMPRTYEAAIAEAKRLAQKGDPQANALLSSGFHDAQGRFTGIFRNEPWANGIVWSMNSMPGVKGKITDFSHKWNPRLVKKLYGAGNKSQLDGEYFDSSEGYVTKVLNFRREHFSIAKTPLCFSSQTKQPAIFRGQIAYEYMREIARELHAKKRLTMANSTPIRICWYAPLLDVMGTETNWNLGNKWKPMSDADLLYRRVMCKGKPYCFLMNTNFEQFSHQKVEKYMQRCLAYGMFPGFFSHNASEKQYFQTPKLYERDRELFKKYVPLCKLVAEAGWEPITNATSDNKQVYLERFGSQYLTAFNDSNQKQTVNIQIERKSRIGSRELISGKPIHWNNGQTELVLPAENVAVLHVRLSP